ncbi:hypothetical protein STCU_12019 [Strigomonas culicis]|uniref:Surface antigen-like protein n=1 Tax=Strigomonas culicis TaxID=28005 RepID=S9TGG1_9TRYP|nr:hypothetical protein STCU_12019 [Strigomonas culicis]|eukprot:EPY15448.1 hypothetical protein STCU_12019 [Strigomonas culicis]
MENCALCSKENFCYQCNTDQAFVVDSSGKCAYCGDHCTACTSSGCIGCSAGYTLTSGECTALCSLIGCSTCASATACAQCNTGLTLLSDGTCSCGIAHCETCFNSVCKECDEGYFYNMLNSTCDLITSSLMNASGKTHVRLQTLVLAATIIALTAVLL